jgi:hypothetical protein
VHRHRQQICPHQRLDFHLPLLLVGQMLLLQFGYVQLPLLLWMQALEIVTSTWLR